MIPDRRMFINEQASADLAFGALREGHDWEALRDALARVADHAGAPVALPPVKLSGLALR